MGIFSFLFGGGKYPTTSKYEAQQAQAKADYGKFNQIAAGNELKKFEELKKVTASPDFKSRVEHLKNDKFSQTDEYRKEQELKALAKSSDIKSYLKFVAAGNDKKAAAAIASADYTEYVSLKKTVESSSFAAKAKVKDSEEAKTLARYKQLSGSSSVKDALKFASSKEYINYKKVQGSDRLQKYEALSGFVKTDAFLAKKKDLENKNRFKESNEAKQLAQLASLEKNKDLKWYFENLKKGTFSEMGKWELSFEDNFQGSKLDAQKWLSGYYWGRKTAGVVYSMADERQKFDDANAKVSGGVLSIQTRAGKAVGKVWNPDAFGFVDKEFEATAAVITTGDSFRQKYGKFEFKVKANAVAPVSENIWLSTDKNNEINVVTFGKSAKGIVLCAGQKSTTISDVKASSDYYIYSLEWTSQKLTWKVNGVEVYSTTTAVPQEEMYIGISSNVIGEGKIGNADMNIEWVKVYTEAK